MILNVRLSLFLTLAYLALALFVFLFFFLPTLPPSRSSHPSQLMSDYWLAMFFKSPRTDTGVIFRRRIPRRSLHPPRQSHSYALGLHRRANRHVKEVTLGLALTHLSIKLDEEQEMEQVTRCSGSCSFIIRVARAIYPLLLLYHVSLRYSLSYPPSLHPHLSIPVSLRVLRSLLFDHLVCTKNGYNGFKGGFVINIFANHFTFRMHGCGLVYILGEIRNGI